MQTEKKNKKRIWILVLLLLICVEATSFALMNRLNLFMPDDSGAIELTETGTSKALNGAAAGENVELEYGFAAYDDKTVWGTDTDVEIFRISYENGEAVATVQSSDGDNVIAPGTGGSYIFKFKNTGEGAVDYTLTVDAYCTPAGAAIPIEAKLRRYDGKWVVGSADAYGDTAALDAAKDSATLGPGRYTYYTLDWQWQFERGADELDTKLGSMAVEQDVTYTIKIRTVAAASDDIDNKGGILIVQTGDTSGILLWVLLAASALMMLFMLLWRRKDDDEAEA